MCIFHRVAPLTLCFLLVFLGASNSSARGVVYSGEVDEIEWTAWPPYCKAIASTRQREQAWDHKGYVSRAEERKWERVLGSNFRAMHHYCNALLMQFREKRPIWLSQGGRVTQSTSSLIGEINYTWVRTPPTNPLYSKIGSDLLLAYQDRDDTAAARKIIQTLLENRPQDRYSYTGAAEFYRKQGEPDKAIEILELGAKRVKKNRTILADLAQDYYDSQQYEKSREYVRLARSKGRKMVKLGKKLDEAGFPVTKE